MNRLIIYWADLDPSFPGPPLVSYVMLCTYVPSDNSSSNIIKLPIKVRFANLVKIKKGMTEFWYFMRKEFWQYVTVSLAGLHSGNIIFQNDQHYSRVIYFLKPVVYTER